MVFLGFTRIIYPNTGYTYFLDKKIFLEKQSLCIFKKNVLCIRNVNRKKLFIFFKYTAKISIFLNKRPFLLDIEDVLRKNITINKIEIEKSINFYKKMLKKN